MSKILTWLFLVHTYPCVIDVIMKKAFIVTALCLLLLTSGCQKTETLKTSGSPAAADQEADQTPYYSGLIEEYRTILAEDPSSLAAITALGNAYLGNGQWTDAVTMYNRVLLYNPKDADVRTDLGTAYRNLGMMERALDAYRTALEFEPDHLDALYNTGVVYALNRKNYRKAIRIWEDLLRIAPNYPQAQQMRFMISTFQQALKKDVQ